MDGNNFDNQQPVNNPVNYGAPVQYKDPKNMDPVPIGTWIGIILLSCIPCVNIIMLFVWAFSEGRESKKNWAKAQLIVTAILIVLYLLISLIFGAAILAALGNVYGGMLG